MSQMIVLLLATLAFAEGPTVQPDLLRRLPSDVTEALTFQEEHVATFPERIEARKKAAVDAKIALRKLEAAQGESTDDPRFEPAKEHAATIARVTITKLEINKAHAEKKSAERSLELAEQRVLEAEGRGDLEQLREAKFALSRAKRRLDDAKNEIKYREKAHRKAEKEVRKIKPEDRELVEQSRAAMQASREARAEARALAAVTAGEIKLLEAEFELAKADLELARARAVAEFRRFDVAPYQAARDAAYATAAEARTEIEALRAKMRRVVK